jgi:predicted nucleic acid-binding protein
LGKEVPIFHKTSPSVAVLDTNVVLDWLVFAQPTCRPIAAAIEQGRLQWIGTQAMREELAHVLGRQLFAAWEPNEVRIWHTWDQFCKMLAPPTSNAITSMRCTDVDDQKFIDLALLHGQWLFSKDRAVLKLARRALHLGIQIATPEKWPTDQDLHKSIPTEQINADST